MQNKDENIGNYIYIRYIRDTSVNILEKNIGRPKIDRNLWKYKKKFIEM